MRRNQAHVHFFHDQGTRTLTSYPTDAVRHLAHRTRGDMASSPPGNEEWSKISGPRVSFDKSLRKWRLKRKYTPSKKLRTQPVQSQHFGSLQKAASTIPLRRRSYEQGQRVDPPPRPDQQQNSGLGPTAEWVAAKLPPGECDSVAYEMRWFI